MMLRCQGICGLAGTGENRYKELRAKDTLAPGG
jgi:hypothetical protein